MNRIVLIGNGFDLAHGLKTSYADFINWYWEQWKRELILCHCSILEDPLCSIELDTEETEFTQWHGFLMQKSITYQQMSGMEFYEAFNDGGLAIMKKTPLLTRICHSIETKGWVDIEADYYALLKECLKKNSITEVRKLHKHFAYLQEKLIEYLLEIQAKSTNKNLVLSSIKDKIYEPISPYDIAIGAQKKFREWMFERGNGNEIQNVLDYYQYEASIQKARTPINIKTYQEGLFKSDEMWNHLNHNNPVLVSDNIMLVNFNYTNIASLYVSPRIREHFQLNNIHGTLDNPQSVIFGYGDEMDKYYQELEDLNDNNYLTYIKSSKYLDASNYRKLLQFAESAPFQIYIMGHSCGNSDRTLLNTLFEHENCISIKPFYYQKEDGSDNYTEIVQNISRNFKDKQALRDKVVPKDYCEPLPQASAN